MNHFKYNSFDDAYQAALDILKPDKRDLQHGLELHRKSLVFDAYGFAPNGPGSMNLSAMQELLAKGALRDEFVHEYEKNAKVDSIENPEVYAKFTEMWQRAGVNCIFQNSGEESNNIEILLHRLGYFTALTDRHREFFDRAANAEDIEKAFLSGKHCLYLTTNGVPLPSRIDSEEHALSFIEVFQHLGVRMMHLSYNRSNLICGGCAEKNDPGLTCFGEKVIREMNRTNVIPDVAHSSNHSATDAAAVSTKPVVISHSVCAALSTHYRAKSDDAIAAVAATGGYIGICAHPPFYQGSGHIDAFLDHIEYAARKFGASAVAIGTDRSNHIATMLNDVAFNQRHIFENFWSPQPAGFKAAAEHFITTAWTNWPLYTVGLVQRGFSDEEIRQIIGGNVMRVIRKTSAKG